MDRGDPAVPGEDATAPAVWQLDPKAMALQDPPGAGLADHPISPVSATIAMVPSSPESTRVAASRHRRRRTWTSISWSGCWTWAASSGVMPRIAPKTPKITAPATGDADRNAARSATYVAALETIVVTPAPSCVP